MLLLLLDPHTSSEPPPPPDTGDGWLYIPRTSVIGGTN